MDSSQSGRRIRTIAWSLHALIYTDDENNHGLALLSSVGEMYSSSWTSKGTSMTDKPSDLVQGTLDMLILNTLALEPLYRYGIAVQHLRKFTTAP
jgi:hypothetical protein